jgi:hypothetical protein
VRSSKPTAHRRVLSAACYPIATARVRSLEVPMRGTGVRVQRVTRQATNDRRPMPRGLAPQDHPARGGAKPEATVANLARAFDVLVHSETLAARGCCQPFVERDEI